MGTDTLVGGRLAAAGLAGAVALTLAGCAGSGASSVATAGANRASSASASTPASSPRRSLSVPGVAELAARVTTAVTAKGTARIVGSSARTRSTGVVRFRGSGADFAVTSETGGRKVSLMILGGVAYLNLGEVRGKTWLRIRPGGTDPLSKGFAPLLAQLSTGLDFTSQLAVAEGATITDVQQAEVSGASVTQYTVTSSEKALLARIDKAAATPEQKKALRAQLKGARSEVVISIDEDDLPVMVESRMIGGPGGIRGTVEYKDWGAPVRLVAPPAAEVIDAAGA